VGEINPTGFQGQSPGGASEAGDKCGLHGYKYERSKCRNIFEQVQFTIAAGLLVNKKFAYMITPNPY